METAIFLSTIMVCLTWIFITHLKLRSSRTDSKEIFESIERTAKIIIEMIEYQEFLKTNKDEKDTPDSDSGDISEQDRS